MIETLDRSKAAALSSTHTLVGFGAGELGVRTLRFLDGHVSYFVDNAESKWNSDWEGGVPVRSVDALRDENDASLVVIVCTESRDAAAAQLNEVAPAARVVQTPLLKDHAVFDRLRHCSTRLLVSAYGVAGGIYLLDGQAGTHRRLAAGSFRGLLTVGEKVVVGMESGTLGILRSLEPWRCDVVSVPDDCTQLHGLAYWPRKHLILAAEARRDAVAVFDADSFARVGEIPISSKSEATRPDWHHVNDLCVVDDHLLVSVISTRGWWQHGVFDGALLEHDLIGGGGFTPIVTGLTFPHSVRVVGDRLCYLESMNGNLRFGDREIAMRFPGFVRGLEGTFTCLYVGQSRNRRVAEATASFDAVSMDSGVYVADPAAKVFRFLPLPELCDVYDILDLESTRTELDATGDPS